MVNLNFNTYLAEDKSIENDCILHTSGLCVVLFQTKNAITQKVEDKEHTNLIQSLEDRENRKVELPLLYCDLSKFTNNHEMNWYLN